ncbi:MAG TPA: type II toxin-antitoxin system RelE/ParE family toxin [Acidiferrobacterales bacterium]|nr:type II toxin-antitoxin system RelE/ParE family toxin [Acidiferrobacterales bacterium]
MDYRVSWSPEALEDVESIAAYIARDSAFYAKAVTTRIIEVARDLRRFPLAGRVVPEFQDESIREGFVYNYRLIYRVRENVVTIAAVIHGKRMLNPLAERIKAAK